MATKVGSLIINLALESGAFRSGLDASQKQLRTATKRMEAYGKDMQGLGTKLSLAVTLPMLAFGKASVDAALESQAAMAQVNASLISMGSAAGRTAGQLQALATDQMHKSLYDDDEILRSVTANLLTFGNIAGTAFDRAQQAAIDLSTHFNKDLQSSTMALGKALNDPIKGMTALNKIGLKFNDQQTAQIKAMMAVGDMAGAQGIIFGELDKRVGGSAAAAAKANPFTMLKHSLDDLQESVGAALIPKLQGLADKTKGLVDAFNNLSPGAQNTIVSLGLIAAAAGPVAYVFGSLATLVAPLSAAFTLLSGEAAMGALGATLAALGTAAATVAIPLVALGAVGALIYSQWDKIGPALAEVGNAIMAAIGPSVTDIIQTARQAFADFMGSKTLVEIKGFVSAAGDLAEFVIKAFGPAITGIFKAFGEILSGAFHAIIDLVKIVAGVLSGDWAGAWQAAKDLVVHVVQGIGGAIASLAEGAIGSLAKLFGGIKTYLQDKLTAVWDWLLGKIESARKAFFALYDAVVGHSYIPDMVDGIAHHIGRLDGEMVKPIEKATARSAAAFYTLSKSVEKSFKGMAKVANLDRGKLRLGLGGLFGGEKANPFGSLGSDARQAVGQASGVFKLGQAGIFGKAANDNFFGAMAAIDPATQAKFKAATTLMALQMGSLGSVNVKVQKSFKDLADATLGALDKMVNAFKGGGFLDILGAVIGLGLQLGSIGAFGKGFQTRVNSIPAHAAGTSFAPGGLSLVGERGPELVNLPRGSQVIPNHALRGGAGGDTYHFQGNLMTPEFWQMINAGDQRAAMAGAMGGQRRTAFQQSRRVA